MIFFDGNMFRITKRFALGFFRSNTFQNEVSADYTAATIHSNLIEYSCLQFKRLLNSQNNGYNYYSIRQEPYITLQLNYKLFYETQYHNIHFSWFYEISCKYHWSADVEPWF